MIETDAQIIDLLNKGWSYSQIQDELQVSSKTIAAARKAHFPITESNTGALSRDTFQLQQKPPPYTKAYSPNKSLNQLTYKKHKTMSTENDNYEDDEEITSQLELEKYRLKLAHELEMEKIQAGREEKEREHLLRERELELVKKNAEEEKRNILFRIKKVVESCEDGEFRYEEVEIILEEAQKVLSESENYCFIHQITFQGSVSHSLLTKAISMLTDLMGKMEEDETYDLKFESAFRRQVSRATFQTF